jgi:hypothetical protein
MKSSDIHDRPTNENNSGIPKITQRREIEMVEETKTNNQTQTKDNRITKASRGWYTKPSYTTTP